MIVQNEINMQGGIKTDHVAQSQISILQGGFLPKTNIGD